jgi:hypothetical protein
LQEAPCSQSHFWTAQPRPGPLGLPRVWQTKRHLRGPAISVWRHRQSWGPEMASGCNICMQHFGEEICDQVLTWRASNIEMLVRALDVLRTRCSRCVPSWNSGSKESVDDERVVWRKQVTCLLRQCERAGEARSGRSGWTGFWEAVGETRTVPLVCAVPSTPFTCNYRSAFTLVRVFTVFLLLYYFLAVYFTRFFLLHHRSVTGNDRVLALSVCLRCCAV